MRYLVDTDWIADWLVGEPEAVRVLAEFRRSGLAISAISYMEIVEGIAGSRTPRRARDGFRAFLHGTRFLVVSRAVADRAATIRLDLRRRKRRVSERSLDIVVAATAVQHGLVLVTRNVRDYEDIGDLQLHRPP